jgi:hypothetical protein
MMLFAQRRTEELKSIAHGFEIRATPDFHMAAAARIRPPSSRKNEGGDPNITTQSHGLGTRQTQSWSVVTFYI